MAHQDRLLDALYRSVLQPKNIGEFVTELQRATKTHMTLVTAHDFITGRGHLPVVVGTPADAVIAYEQRYGMENPWLERSAELLFHTGRLLLTDSYVSLKELKRTTYWSEFLRPLDVEHCVGLCGIRDEGKVVVLNAAYSPRDARHIPRDMKLFERIAPHWVNACAIQRKLGLLEENLITMQQALNKVALAVFLLDAGGAIVRMNEGAEQLLREARLVTQRGRRLSARRSLDAVQLDRAIAAALAAESKLDVPANLATKFVLHDALGKAAAFASVNALTAPRSPDSETQPVRALVFIRPLDAHDSASLQEALAALYRLTAAEARLAVALHSNGDLEQACAEMTIRTDTARSRLKVVYDKLGVHSQAALTKLISDLSFVLGHG